MAQTGGAGGRIARRVRIALAFLWLLEGPRPGSKLV
jgi:hypothetical protein